MTRSTWTALAMTPIRSECLPFAPGDPKWVSDQRASDAIIQSNELGDNGNLEDALAVLDAAIEQSPKHPYLFYNAGHYLSLKAEFEKACAAYRQSLALDSTSPSVWASYGYALARSGRQQEAIEAYDQALSLDPTAGEIHFLKAASLQALGNPKAAELEMAKGKQLGANPQKKLVAELFDKLE